MPQIDPRLPAGLRRLAVLAGLVGLVVGGLPAARASANPAPASRYGFAAPDAAALAGSHLYVANRAGNSVTEISTTSGRLVKVLRAPSLRGPDALVAAGPGLWVADGAGGSVTELSLATGRVVRDVGGLSSPVALATDCEHALFVLGRAGVVTKLSLATGKVLGRAAGHQFGFDRPTAVAWAAGHVYVADAGGDAVSIIDPNTMKLQALRRSGFGFADPTGLSVLGGRVWVTDTAGQSLTELVAASGKLVRTVPDISGYLPAPGPVAAGDGDLYVASPPGGSPMITRVIPGRAVRLPWMMCNTNGPYTFSNPQALVVDGAHLWVVNQGGGAGAPAGNSVTEMDAMSGALVRVLR